MRYRLQIEELLDCWCIAVTTIRTYGGTVNHTTRLYTVEREDLHDSDLSGIVGWLAMTLAESQG